MDNFPAEPASQQIPFQSEEPSKKKGLKRFVNVTSWIIFFALLPVTILIFVSQNTIPGDLFYPVKRSLENAVLAAASVSPATRAAFRTDLTTRRFDEAEKLLLASARVNGLKDFVTEIQAAQNEVSAISNPVKKQKLQEKIKTSVIEYEERLDAVRTQLVTREKAVFLPTDTPAIIPTSAPISFPTSTPTQPIASKSPTAVPTTAPIPSIDVPTQFQIQTTVAPTQTRILIPTLTPMPTPIPMPLPTDEQKTIETVDKVQDFLRCLKGTLPPHKECAPPEINSLRFNSENQQEGQNEEKSELEEKPEEEKEEKENKNEEDRQKPEKMDESEELDAEISNP